MLANIGAYVGVSLIASPSAEEHRQASVFVDAFREPGGARFWRGTASLPDLYNLLARFLGAAVASDAFRQHGGALRHPGIAMGAHPAARGALGRCRVMRWKRYSRSPSLPALMSQESTPKSAAMQKRKVQNQA